MSAITEGIQVLGGMAGAAVGAYVGFRLGLKSQRLAQRASFLERQLREFYGPLVALEAEIRALCTVRNEVSSACNAAWQDVCAALRHQTPDRNDFEAQFEPYKRALEAEGIRFREV